MDRAKALKRKIDTREATIGIIGLGYVGLPLAVGFARTGFRVTGIDVDTRKVAAVRAGRSHIEDVTTEELAPLVRKKLLTARQDYEGCDALDVLIICVPTPLRKTKDPDISYIVAALDQLSGQLRAGQLVILESTTYPGTTEEVLRPRLESGGLAVGRDFFLAFSPERVDPGNRQYKTQNTPKVVGGSTPACTQVAAHLYRQCIETVHAVSSTQVAEMIKLLENTFRAVNIALVNEIALMCERLRLDVWEVIDGAATKPFGFMRFYPGPGIGGHCIPLDPHYLSWKLRTLNYSARFIELASEINGNMPVVVVRRAAELLNHRRKSINGARILVLGVSYKKDTNDQRESPAFDIMRLLEEQGAKLSYHDPYNPTVRMENGHELKSTALTPAALGRFDLVLIVTDHSVVDYGRVVRHAKLVLDTRNATRDVAARSAKVHRL